MQNESVSTGNRKTQRKRGGQRGNQNARQHGFYSSLLNPAEICEFWNIVNLEGVEPEIAVLRLKLRSVLQRSPDNQRVLAEAARLLSKWLHTKYRLKDKETGYIKMFLRRILQDKTIPSLSPPDSPVKPDAAFLQNESGVLLQSNQRLAHPARTKSPIES